MRRLLIFTAAVSLFAPAAWAADPGRAPGTRATPAPRVGLPQPGKTVKIKGAGYKNPALHGTKKKKLVPRENPTYLPGTTNDANIINHPP